MPFSIMRTGPRNKHYGYQFLCAQIFLHRSHFNVIRSLSEWEWEKTKTLSLPFLLCAQQFRFYAVRFHRENLCLHLSFSYRHSLLRPSLYKILIQKICSEIFEWKYFFNIWTCISMNADSIFLMHLKSYEVNKNQLFNANLS